VVVLLVLAVYWPVTRHGFVNLDDAEYVWENGEVLRGISRRGILWAFTSVGYAANWHPLTWLSHMADVSLLGMDAGAFHLVNLLLHAAAAALLVQVALMLTGRPAASFAAAALFALHPLRVESVAWISQRKEMLGGLALVLFLAAYLRYVRRPDASRMFTAAGVLALGLLAKPTLTVVPLLLPILDWWPLGRAQGRGTTGRAAIPGLLGEKIPLLLLAVPAALLTMAAQSRGGAVVPFSYLSLPWRLANAAWAGGWYLARTLWPESLALIYPHPGHSLAAGRWLSGLLLLLGSGAAALFLRRRRPWLLAGWLWCLVSLLPVIGILQVGPQGMADRYTYLPHLGLALVLALVAGREGGGRVVAPGVAAALVLALAARRQTDFWRDDATLFTRALAVEPRNVVALNKRGLALLERGLLREAEVDFRRALALNPRHPETLNNLGETLLRDRPEEAAALFDRVLLQGLDARALRGRAAARERAGRRDEAGAPLPLPVPPRPGAPPGG
jgi:hypothetical protein